jgi:glycosyltransferase involved in cell wall biosynthesis
MSRSSGLRILIVSRTLPYPTGWGFNIRVFHIIRHLAERNRVSLLCYGAARGEEEAIARQALSGLCEAIFTVPDIKRSGIEKRCLQARSTLSRRSFHMHRLITARMQAAVSNLLRDGAYDLVQVESSSMAGFDFGDTPVVLDEHNLEYELLRRSNRTGTSFMRRLFAGIENGKVETEEVSRWRRVDGCVLTSKRESDAVTARVPEIQVAVVPNAVDSTYFRPLDSPVKPLGIVFTGLLTYRPNVDAVNFFVRDIFPLVRRHHADALFTVVGSGLPRHGSTLRVGVVHAGHVEDVRPYLAQAAVVVAPLRIGSGTRLKILEALAMARPVVTTSLGCEGLEVTHGEHLLIADDASTFAAAVVRLLVNPGEAAAIGRRGRALVERRYRWEQSVAELERLHHSILRSVGRATLAGAIL